LPGRAPPPFQVNRTSSCALRTGKLRSITAFTSWKSATFAPMPSASERSAARVNTGLLRSERRPYRRSQSRVSSPRESRFDS
jgi:hypothetical protein